MPRLQPRLLNSMISERWETLNQWTNVSSFTASCSAGTFSRNGLQRLKIGSDAYATNGKLSVATTQPIDHSKSSLSIQQAPSELPRIPDDALHRAWRTDPFVSNPQSISTVLSQFFGHIDNAIVIRFLPEDIFKSWVVSSAHRKSPDDMMLLYSILAIGVILSRGPKDTAFEYAQVAHYAQKSLTTASPHLAQSRILLALYNVAVSRFSKDNELICSATATGAYLQLNEDIDGSKDADLAVYPFGMTRKCYAETRRRTLWSLFMVERLSPIFPKRPTMIHAEDIHIRLPSDSESFERQLDARMLMFNPYESSFNNFNEKSSDISSHLVEIVHGVTVFVFVTKDATIITPIAVVVHVTNRIVIRVLATILKGGRSVAQAIAPLRDVAPGLGVSWGVRNSRMRWMV
ncbi:hypothetical protein E5D57_003568 [Metarhizium anisopliae]|nr:hypothetical protein E5D57_003568 [Metarhizium anisopliae]